MSVTITGHSDDIIAIAGDIEDEFYAFSPERGMLAFSDGTLLSYEYGAGGRARFLARTLPLKTIRVR